VPEIIHEFPNPRAKLSSRLSVPKENKRIHQTKLNRQHKTLVRHDSEALLAASNYALEQKMLLVIKDAEEDRVFWRVVKLPRVMKSASLKTEILKRSTAEIVQEPHHCFSCQAGIGV
jgi:hypothetical protein